MSSVHNDLHSWAAKARKNGNTTIEIDLATADAAADLIVELATKVGEMEYVAAQSARMRDALEEISNPLLAMQRRAEAEGAQIDGRAAAALAIDAGYLRNIARKALSNDAPAQCCMCGKTGLSTTEGDGGTECELGDGRWVCSSECWGKAVDPAPPVQVPDGWQLVPTKLSPEMRRGFREIAMPLVAYSSLDAERAAREDAHWKSILKFAEVFHPAPAPQDSKPLGYITQAGFDQLKLGIDCQVIHKDQRWGCTVPVYAGAVLPASAVADYEQQEVICTDAALSQWRSSKSRPDLDEEARVRGAIEAYKRQAFALTHLPPLSPEDQAVGIGIFRDGTMISFVPGTSFDDEYKLPDDKDERKLLYTHPATSAREEGTDGYVAAFYELAKLLDIGAQGKSPKEVWDGEMLPRIKAALSAPTDEGTPVFYVSEQQLPSCIGSYLPTRAEAERNFQLPLYRRPLPQNMRPVPMGYLVRRYNEQGILLDTELSFTKPVLHRTSTTKFIPLFAPQDFGEDIGSKPDA